MDTDDSARYRTIPLVRLPSIDHGLQLAPFPEGMVSWARKNNQGNPR
jgi:hypothetical protein